jgi:hypothetical protein
VTAHQTALSSVFVSAKQAKLENQAQQILVTNQRLVVKHNKEDHRTGIMSIHERAKLHTQQASNKQPAFQIKHQASNSERASKSNLKHQIKQQASKDTTRCKLTSVKQITSDSIQIKPWISNPKRASSQTTGIQIKQRALNNTTNKSRASSPR